jgi:hypothetical protein
MSGTAKKIIVSLAGIFMVLTPVAVFATPSSVDRITNHIEPLIKTDFIKGLYFVASSTSQASTFPYASTTVTSAQRFCLTGDSCIATWPSGSGSSTFGTSSISALAPLLWNTTTAQMSWTGLATTTQPSSSNVLVSNGAAGVYGVATGTISGAGGVTASAGSSVIGSALTVTCTAGTGSATGCIQSADWTVFNNKISSSSLSALTPIIYNSSTGVFSWVGLATTSQPSAGNFLVSNGAAGVYGIATSTPTVTAPITYSGTFGSFVGGAAGTFACTTATGSVAGCISAADWTKFNLKAATGSAETKGNLAFWLTTAGSPPLLGSVATGTLAASGLVSVTAGQFIIGSGATVSLGNVSANTVLGNPTGASAAPTAYATSSLFNTAAAGVTGILSASDWTKFNMKVGTSGPETRGQLAAWGTTAGSPANLYSVATGTISATSPVTVTAGTAAVGGAPVFAWDFAVANTWTGKQTFTSASSTNFSCITFCQIPASTSQTPTVAGDIALDTTNNQLKVGTGGSTAVNDPRRFLTVSTATSTAWTGTTTLPEIPIPTGMTFSSVQCKTNAGTLNVQVSYGQPATNLAMLNASTTMGTYTWSTNNTPPAATTTSFAFGTPASSPTQISCTVSALVTGT